MTNQLDKLALKYKTDKGSSHHNYTRVYNNLIDNTRKLNLVELGIDKGYSLRMWADWMPSSKIYGIDLNLIQDIDNNRIQMEFGNACNANFCKDFLRKYNLEHNIDIFIDDGSHLVHEQLLAFDLYWPHVKSKGLYIIEDLHTDYNPVNNKRFSDFVKDVVDIINWRGKYQKQNDTYSHGNPTRAYEDLPLKWDYGDIDPRVKLNYLEKTIESVTIHKSIVIFIKR